MQISNQRTREGVTQTPRTAAPTPQAPAPTRIVPPAPDLPSLTHRLLPRSIRNSMAALGWWQNPIPQPPSAHLEQTLAVLGRYGWCRSLDFSPTGRMCIRGAQTLLEHTGHVTPAGRARAVDYMQQTLAEAGVHTPFFAWNDYTGRTFVQVNALITRSADAARKNGE